ncbi:hypothetical protein HMPREF3155_08415 [Corynebacterium sp. HMSC06D04]|uniref:hypothetical protein n=1 Tax=Corynebacterium sp. HMSC06D04 TaxID=1581123 RepID=UPI0008A108A1|nr:hypothetical protein [Corynebacterium sp. HMSC06D04]OFT50922.1 hypothetical protein HMPREF3155_08415 [Corynebacterium sp. HMSC06D04]
MKMKSEFESNIIFVQPPRSEPRDAVALAGWYTAAAVLQEEGFEVHLVEREHWSEELSEDSKNFVFFMDLELADEVLSSPMADHIASALFVSPHSFVEKLGADWVRKLREPKFASIDIFTDCQLSRSVIEQRLDTARRNVYILAPDFSLLYGAFRGCTPDSVAELLDRLTVDKCEQTHSRSAFAVAKEGFDALREQINLDAEWNAFDDADFSDVHNEPCFESLWSALDSTLETWRPRARQLEDNRSTLLDYVAPWDSDLRDLKVAVMGTKLTFIDELSQQIKNSTGARVEMNEWKFLSGPSNKEHANELVRTSDVIIGEWARPNNFWIQDRARAEAKLIVRAHRYEVTTDFPHSIDMDKYYAGVVIVPWVGRKLVQEFGWPAEKMVYIPNYINGTMLSRPKSDDVRFTLGIVGITPSLKRLDLALNLLAELRAIDKRFTLRVRGSLPTEHVNWERDPRIAQQWEEVRLRLELDPLVRNAVFFDPPGRDMARWYEKIGVILSLSDVEGSHVALAEGISSGALPVARRWPGIQTLWPEDFIFDDFDSAVQWVSQVADVEWFHRTTERLQNHKSLDHQRVLAAWRELLQGNRSAAQECFGPIDWEAPAFDPIE